MSVKRCLTKGEMTKVNKAVDKRKPATRQKQRLAGKQEELFGKIIANKSFMNKVNKLKTKKLRIDTIHAEFKRIGSKIGVDASRAKLKRMFQEGLEIPKVKVKPKISKIPKPVIKPEIPKVIPKVKGVKFNNIKSQKIYDKHYNEFMADPKLKTKKDFKKEWKKIVAKDIKKSTTEWKFASTNPAPSGLKIKAENMEKGIEVPTRLGQKVKRSAFKFANKIKEQDYLETRALHQAYMDKKGIKEITLYRGVGGETGVKIAKDIKKLKSGSSVTINQNSLVGYSSDYKVADSFGAAEGGITIRMKVKVTDIVLHDDLWGDLFGKVVDIMDDWGLDGLDGEKEFMCLGKKMIIKAEDITAKRFEWVNSIIEFEI